VIEWVVDCGEGDLATSNEVRLAAKITYHGFSPKRDNLTEVCDELFFGLGFLANGFGVGDMAKVLVQTTLEKVQVPGLESLAPFFDEFDLWRDGHCDDETGGYVEVIFLRNWREAQDHPLYTHPEVRSTDSSGAQSTIQAGVMTHPRQ
jgi:hypothetical protein